MLGFLSRKFFLLRNNLGMFRGLFNFKNLKKNKKQLSINFKNLFPYKNSFFLFFRLFI
jgi:hypothetical protein